MADLQLGNIHGVPVRGNQNINGGANARTAFTDPNLATVTALRARLTAISAVSYSPERLDTMTKNDMIYAIRVHDHAGGLN